MDKAWAIEPPRDKAESFRSQETKAYSLIAEVERGLVDFETSNLTALRLTTP